MIDDLPKSAITMEIVGPVLEFEDTAYLSREAHSTKVHMK